MRLDKKVEFSRCCETIACASIDRLVDGDFLFIPNTHKLCKRNCFAAHALYDGKRAKRLRIPIRIVNAVESCNVLEKGTILGKVIKVETTAERCNMFENDEDKSHKSVINDILLEHEQKLNSKELNKLKDLLFKYKSIFSLSSTDVGEIKKFKHEINTGNNPPIACAPRRVPIHLEDKIENLIDKLQDQKIIRKTTSAWNSPIVIVPKRNGDIRLCVDYRRLNTLTQKSNFPIPLTNQIFDQLNSNKYFTSIDLSMGYHQLAIKNGDQQKTAFTVKSGQYEFMRMPFGLSSAPASFQYVMSSILKD